MNLTEFNNFVKKRDAVLVYLSTKDCSVCKGLKPKILNLLNKFPKMEFLSIDCEDQKEIAAQNMVFTVPSILVFFYGKESIRKSRNLGIEQLKGEIERTYNLIFE